MKLGVCSNTEMFGGPSFSMMVNLLVGKKLIFLYFDLFLSPLLKVCLFKHKLKFKKSIVGTRNVKRERT